MKIPFDVKNAAPAQMRVQAAFPFSAWVGLCRKKGAAALIDAFRGVQTDKRLVIAGGSSASDQFVEKLYRNAYLYSAAQRRGENAADSAGGAELRLLLCHAGHCGARLRFGWPQHDLPTGRYGDPAGDIADLVQQRGRSERLSKGKGGSSEFVCGEYQWDTIVDQTLEIYRASTKK